MTQEAFKEWWHNEGSQAPYTHHDCEEHTMRMCEIAWANGAYKEREACAKLAEEYGTWGGSGFYEWFKKLGAEIRARGEQA
jgi:hypothetical protein